ncbi:MAG: hypothetical protein EOP09_08080 [Proteobacteria bacterium]|nr:MAG: hypothetical protein EOP09_08080 [Pseudomonadota bacterium]
MILEFSSESARSGRPNERPDERLFCQKNDVRRDWPVDSVPPHRYVERTMNSNTQTLKLDSQLDPGMQTMLDTLVEIIRKTSTEMPDDVTRAIEAGQKVEADSSSAKYAMDIICDNIGLAKKKSQPLCQDTGTILFFIHYPAGTDYDVFQELIKRAVAFATQKGYLRQNSVDSLTGENNGTNVGPGSPAAA